MRSHVGLGSCARCRDRSTVAHTERSVEQSSKCCRRHEYHYVEFIDANAMGRDLRHEGQQLLRSPPAARPAFSTAARFSAAGSHLCLIWPFGNIVPCGLKTIPTISALDDFRKPFAIKSNFGDDSCYALATFPTFQEVLNAD